MYVSVGGTLHVQDQCLSRSALTWLDTACDRVASTFRLVADRLNSRLLAVWLHRGRSLVGRALTKCVGHVCGG